MRYGNRSLAPQAWLLIPLALLVGGLILFFGRDGKENHAVRVLESTTSGMELYIVPAQAEGSNSRNLPADGQARRGQAMANLAEFRAHYQQLAPFFGVIATDDSVAGATFAKELGDLLAEFNLGNRVQQPQVVPGAGGEAGVLLRCSPADLSVARDMITALAPLLRGNVRITFDQTLGIADLLLAVSPDARASGP